MTPARSARNTRNKKFEGDPSPAARQRAERSYEDRAPFNAHFLLPVLVIIAGLVAYSNSFSGAFVLDDDKHVINNPRIRSILPLYETMGGRRPIVDLSLAINYRFAEKTPKLDTRGFHAFNLTVHLLAGLTLFGVVRRTLLLDRLRMRFGPAAPWLALVVALLWVVHPLQTQSVTYIIQRGESMMGLFYLLTLYCVIRGADASRGAWRYDATVWYVAAVVSCALGMGSKAVMVTAPVVILLYDRIFLSRSFSETLRRRWGLHVGLTATWFVLVACGVVEGVLGWKAKVGTVGFAYKGATPIEYLSTQLGVIAYYLRLALWPNPLCLDYGWPFARTVWDALVPGIVTLLLFSATLWALGRRPALGFTGMWFFLILAPTSSIVPVKDPIFEHRMYLPLAAVAVCAVVGGYLILGGFFGRLSGRFRVRPEVAVVLVGFTAVSLTYRTYLRNRDYRSDLVAWREVINKRPGNHRAYLGLGTALFDRKRFREAENAFAQAVRIQPKYADGYYNYGNALSKNGKLDEAVEAYRRSLRFRPRNAKCLYNLANTYKKLRRYDEAVTMYNKALRIDPRHVSAHINLGNTLRLLGRTGEAITEYRKALQIDPQHANAHFNLGVALRRQGRLEEALAEFRLALRYKPNHQRARKALDAVSAKLTKDDTE